MYVKEQGTFMSKKCILPFMAAAIMITLSACGASNDNITAGMSAIKSLDYQSALESFETAKKSGENERLIYRGMGIAYMGMTDYTQASVCFEEALRLSKGLVEAMDYDLNYYLASAYTKEDRLSEAEATYDAILTMKPEEADAYFLRGNVRLGLGKTEEAKADFDKVAAMEPENYDRLIQIFEVLNYYGQAEEGKKYLQDALGQENSKMTAYDKGRMYYYLKEYQQAYVALEEARDGGSADAYLYLGRAYEATGDYNYASSVYNSYLAKDTSNAEIYNQLGLCEIAKGDYEKALSAFQAGMNAANNNIQQTLAYNEIVAYEYLGDFRKANVLMETYLQNYPDDTKAQREHDFLSTR